MSGEDCYSGEVVDLVKTWDSPQSSWVTISACFPVAPAHVTRHPCERWGPGVLTRGSVSRWAGGGHGRRELLSMSQLQSYTWWLGTRVMAHVTGMNHWRWSPVSGGRNCVSQCHLGNHLSDISLTVSDDPSQGRVITSHGCSHADPAMSWVSSSSQLFGMILMSICPEMAVAVRLWYPINMQIIGLLQLRPSSSLFIVLNEVYIYVVQRSNNLCCCLPSWASSTLTDEYRNIWSRLSNCLWMSYLYTLQFTYFVKISHVQVL